jgi:hypothetical protein
MGGNHLANCEHTKVRKLLAFVGGLDLDEHARQMFDSMNLRFHEGIDLSEKQIAWLNRQ